MHLISEEDAIKTVHKAIGILLTNLPKIKCMDGKEICTDPTKYNAYLEANKTVCGALRNISSWHTEDPEENREYFVTWQASLNGHTFRKICILEWDYDHWIIEDWMRESYEDISVVAWMQLPEEYVEDWK